MKLNIRHATQEDLIKVHHFIRQLAIFEKAEHEHTASFEHLTDCIFGTEAFVHCLVAEDDKKQILGTAVFYFKYSTWKGKSLFLEDLIVDEPYRKLGVGAKLFKEVVNFAKSTHCRRMDWQVLDWNTPAIRFYEKFGATLSAEWLNGQLTESQINNFTQA